MSITFGTKLPVGYFLIDFWPFMTVALSMLFFSERFNKCFVYHKSFKILPHVEYLLTLFGLALTIPSPSLALNAVAEQ